MQDLAAGASGDYHRRGRIASCQPLAPAGGWKAFRRADTGDRAKMYLVKLDRTGKHIFSKMFVDAHTVDAFSFPLQLAVRFWATS